MISLLPIATLTLPLTLALGEPAPTERPQQSKPIQVAVTCFKTGEQTSGTNKICYYDCLGSTVAINIKNYEICPLNIQQ